jgi:hypothetical protein
MVPHGHLDGRGFTAAPARRTPPRAALACTSCVCGAAYSGPLFPMVTHAIDHGVPAMAVATVLSTAGLAALSGTVICGLGSAARQRPTWRSRRTPMGARSEALAKQFEAKAEEAVAVIEQLSAADWTQVTEAEHWTVGVTAHYLAGALEPVAGLVSTMASGQSRGPFTRAMLDEMNARHAQEHAHCTQAETIALVKRGAAAAAAVVRGLHDEQLAKRGTVFTDAPPMPMEQCITGCLIGHIEAHVGSLRLTVSN